MTVPSIKPQWKIVWDLGKIIAVVFAGGMAYNKLDNVQKDVEAITIQLQGYDTRLNTVTNRVSFLEGRANASDKREDPPFIPSTPGPRN